MLASAILDRTGILSTGFGDATVKYVSAYRGENNQTGIERTIRATLSINTLLGAFLDCWFGSRHPTPSITFSRLTQRWSGKIDYRLREKVKRMLDSMMRRIRASPRLPESTSST